MEYILKLAISQLLHHLGVKNEDLDLKIGKHN
jgi:hypothetical protein